MATRERELVFQIPDNSGNVIWEPAAINFGANDRYPGMVYRFRDTSTRDGLGFRVTVPKEYVGSPAFRLLSSTTVTSGSQLRVEIDYTSIAKSGESLDPSADQENLTLNQAPSGTARLGLESTLNITASNLAVDDVIEGTIFRDGAQAGTNADDVVSNWYLFEGYLTYADA